MSVNESLRSLFSEAAREEREDIISAIAPFISMADLLHKVEETGLNRIIKSSIVRSDYSTDDLRALFNGNLIQKVKGFKEIVQSLHKKVGNQETLPFIVEHLMAHGFYKQAKECFVKITDKDEYRKRLQTRNSHFKSRKNYGEALFLMAGKPGTWDRNTIDLLNMFQLNIGDGLSITDSDAKESWSKSRIDAQIDYLGDYWDSINGETPAININSGKIQLTRARDFVEAFCLEAFECHQKAEKGGWHDRNFPSYLPALVSENQIDLIDGLVEVKFRETHPDSGKPDHAFTDPSGNVSDADVAMAMSLYSVARCNTLQHPPVGMKLVLVDYSAFGQLQKPNDEKLSGIMRFHRPELLRWFLDTKERSYNVLQSFAGGGLYLRGVPMGAVLDNNYIQVEREYTNASALRLFNTASEKELISTFMDDSKYVDTHRSYEHGIRINTIDMPVKQAVRYALEEIDQAKNYLGFMPALTLSGSLEFYEELSRLNLGAKVLSANLGVGDSMCGEYGISKHYRLSARLGACTNRLERLFGSTPEEQLAKAMRIKDENDLEKIKGLLDRVDLVTLANLAKTKLQVDFIVANFDLFPVLKDLPANFKKKVATERARSDFEL